jgi:hypothetical protein
MAAVNQPACGSSAGLLKPSRGEIEIPNPLGFVFQNPDHQLVMPTVGADVAFGLVSEGLSTPAMRAQGAGIPRGGEFIRNGKTTNLMLSVADKSKESPLRGL